MKTQESDFIIVGGGTAGLVLASRLSEDPSISVTVLEAGPHFRGLNINIPAGIGKLYEQGRYHWPYKSAPEPFADDKELTYKMGRVVGGSSAINGMIWVRGNPLDYDDWAANGCTGWSYSDIEPLFRRIESFEDKSVPEMGHEGPISVAKGRPQDQVLSNAFMESAAVAGYRINPNHNSGDQDGFCAMHRNTGKGRRSDVFQGYIAPFKQRANLVILSGYSAQKIEFDGTAATGVLASKNGVLQRFNARREVLLSAGGIASPQLLELSGVGNTDTLTSLGITPHHHLPGVGENFHTHPTLSLTYSCTQDSSIHGSTQLLGQIRAGLEWLLHRTGPAATNHFEAGAFLRSHPEADRPDFQLTFLPLALAPGGMTKSSDYHGFQVYTELVGCKSRGSTHITSTDSANQPLFNFNFLQDPRDKVILREAIRVIREVVAQAPFDEYRGQELEPGAQISSVDDIDAWMRKTVNVSHHLSGSCKMGSADDPLAVVGPDLRVHGLQRLRVIDASIAPTVPTGNTHATTIAIGEKGADLIKSEAS